jgi:hypothetical protein
MLVPKQQEMSSKNWNCYDTFIQLIEWLNTQFFRALECNPIKDTVYLYKI